MAASGTGPGPVHLDTAAVQPGSVQLATAAVQPDPVHLDTAAVQPDPAQLATAAVRPDPVQLATAAVQPDPVQLATAAVEPTAPSGANVSNTQEIRLSSDTLIKASQFFKDSLKPAWLANEEAGADDCEPDVSHCIKSYELELDASGCDFLIGRTPPTSSWTRVHSAKAITKDTRYRTFVRQMSGLRGMRPSQQQDLFEDTISDSESINAELNLVSTVNMLGLSMICGFPRDTDRVLMVRLRRMQVFPISMTYLVQRLVRWLSCHNIEANVQSRLVHFIRSEVPASEIHRRSIPYVRIACVLRDQSLFRWILDKNPLFANDFCFSMSYMDARLGLDAWVPAFNRHLVFLGSILRGLQNLPDRVEPYVEGVFTADEWNLVVFTWNGWLQQRARTNRAEYRYIDSSILALYSVASSAVVLPFWSFKYTPVVAEKASDYLQHALVLAKEQIARYMTVNEDEFLGFRIKNHNFFAKYGYPWLYRQDDETDDRLFNLIATNNLFNVDETLRHSA